MRGAGAAVRIQLARAGLQQVVIAAVTVGTKEDTGARTRQPLERQATVFERLVCDLEYQSLLRVHLARLAWRDSEKCRIEGIDIGKKAAPARAHLPHRGGIRVVQARGVPAVDGCLANGVDAVVQYGPEGAERVCPGKATRHTDDGNRLRALALELVNARSQLLQRHQCLAQLSAGRRCFRRHA